MLLSDSTPFNVPKNNRVRGWGIMCWKSAWHTSDYLGVYMFVAFGNPSMLFETHLLYLSARLILSNKMDDFWHR